jgi:hypothetical protein
MSGESTTVSEENRLSAMVRTVYDEVAVIPRGAVFREAKGKVLKNPMFTGTQSHLECGGTDDAIGLNKNELLHLSSYRHLRSSLAQDTIDDSDVSAKDALHLDQPNGKLIYIYIYEYK